MVFGFIIPDITLFIWGGGYRSRHGRRCLDEVKCRSPLGTKAATYKDWLFGMIPVFCVIMALPRNPYQNSGHLLVKDPFPWRHIILQEVSGFFTMVGKTRAWSICKYFFPPEPCNAP